MKKIIGLIAAFAIAAVTLFVPVSANNTISVSIYNYKTGSYMVENASLDLPNADTPIKALKQLETDGKISALVVNGSYVSSIGGYTEFRNGKYSGWNYKVNGKMPSIAADRYPLNAGDQLVWTYAVTAEQAGLGGSSSALTSSEPAQSVSSANTSAAVSSRTLSSAASGAKEESAQSATVPSDVKQPYDAEQVIAVSNKYQLDTIKKSSVEFLQKTPGEWTALSLITAGTIPNEPIIKSVGSLAKGKDVLVTDYEKALLNALALSPYHEAADIKSLKNKVFNNKKLTAQGLNGPIFALYILQSTGADFADNTLWTTEKLFQTLIGAQNSDGGFSLSDGLDSDPDVTAMAITALSGFSSDSDAAVCINKALTWLSEHQHENGGFGLDETNCESTAQVLIALSSLRIPVTDARFVKNGKNAMDALVSFDTGKGFCHIAGTQADIMATEQATMAIAAYQKQASIYRFEANIQAGGNTRSGVFALAMIAAIVIGVAGFAIYYLRRKPKNEI